MGCPLHQASSGFSQRKFSFVHGFFVMYRRIGYHSLIQTTRSALHHTPGRFTEGSQASTPGREPRNDHCNMDWSSAYSVEHIMCDVGLIRQSAVCPSAVTTVRVSGRAGGAATQIGEVLAGLRAFSAAAEPPFPSVWTLVPSVRLVHPSSSQRRVHASTSAPYSLPLDSAVDRISVYQRRSQITAQ